MIIGTRRRFMYWIYSTFGYRSLAERCIGWSDLHLP